MRRIAPEIVVLCVCFALANPALAADISGLKGLGGSGGTSLVVGDWQFRTNARPRLTGDAVFKWGWNPEWALIAMAGFGWNAYGSTEQWLRDVELLQSLGYPPEEIAKVTTLAPFTVGVERRFGTGQRVPYIGAGGGVYVQTVLFDRSVGQDPRTGATLRTTSFGIYGRAGLEQFISDQIAFDYDALYHIVFSEDREKFPDPNSADTAIYGKDFRSYGGDSQWIQIRFGIRYYWGGEG